MNSKKINIPDCADCSNKNSIFCHLPLDEKNKLSDNKGSNFFKKGQVIFYEGNHPHGLYCIHKGKVKVSKLGDEGKDQIVRFAGTGDLLGYRAILSGEEYKATATAIEDCYICHLSSDNFFDVMKNNNNFSLDVIKMLSTDLKKSEQQLINISQKTVRERIAETLLLLKEKFGLDSENQLTISLTRREIGDIAGVTTETTIRTLSDFNKEELILLSGKKIKIVELKKLIRVANISD